MKAAKTQKHLKEIPYPVHADLSNDYKLIIFEIDQTKISPFMRLFWEEQQKYL